MHIRCSYTRTSLSGRRTLSYTPKELKECDKLESYLDKRNMSIAAASMRSAIYLRYEFSLDTYRSGFIQGILSAKS